MQPSAREVVAVVLQSLLQLIFGDTEYLDHLSDNFAYLSGIHNIEFNNNKDNAIEKPPPVSVALEKPPHWWMLTENVPVYF